MHQPDLDNESDQQLGIPPCQRPLLMYQLVSNTVCSGACLHNQPVRSLVSARAYQPANSIFLSQQISTSRAYQFRNQPANKLNISTISETICLLVQSTICDILFGISYKIADSGDGGDGVPFEGVEICCFNLVSKLPGCNI